MRMFYTFMGLYYYICLSGVSLLSLSQIDCLANISLFDKLTKKDTSTV